MAQENKQGSNCPALTVSDVTRRTVGMEFQTTALETANKNKWTPFYVERFLNVNSVGDSCSDILSRMAVTIRNFILIKLFPPIYERKRLSEDYRLFNYKFNTYIL